MYEAKERRGKYRYLAFAGGDGKKKMSQHLVDMHRNMA